MAVSSSPAPSPDRALKQLERERREESDARATVWAFLWVLFAFKLATVGLIFWHLSTFETGVVLGATTWYWFPVMGVLAAAPVALHLRLRKMRARRAELLRAEWMVPGEEVASRRQRARRSPG